MGARQAHPASGVVAGSPQSERSLEELTHHKRWMLATSFGDGTAQCVDRNRPVSPPSPHAGRCSVLSSTCLSSIGTSRKGAHIDDDSFGLAKRATDSVGIDTFKTGSCSDIPSPHIPRDLGKSAQ